MPNSYRIFKRLSELLDTTGQTGYVFLTAGTPSFVASIKGMRTFADTAALASAAPEFTGQLAVVLDFNYIVRGTGTSNGNWSNTINVPNLTAFGGGAVDLTGAATVAVGDSGVGFTSTGATNTRSQLFGATTAITGGGTLALGGFTLTVPSTGTAVTTTTINNATLPASFTTLAASGAVTFTNSQTITTAGATGLLLNQDTGTASSSARLYLKSSGQQYVVMNSGDNFVIRYGATFGSGNGTTGLTMSSTGAITLASTLSVVGAIIAMPQTLIGAGAVDVVTHTTKLTTNGIGNALTLANGTNGQMKKIVYAVEGGGTDTAILTPTTATGYTTITFAVVGDSVELVYFTTQGWMIASIHGAVAA